MRNSRQTIKYCDCGNKIHNKRWELGYRSCLICGEKDARKVIHTVVPLHKSNYIVVSDLNDLKGLNKNNKDL